MPGGVYVGAAGNYGTDVQGITAAGKPDYLYAGYYQYYFVGCQRYAGGYRKDAPGRSKYGGELYH